jgi:ABC-type transport system substrate-binding protein
MNRLYKRLGLILICISMLTLIFAANPIGATNGQRGPRVDTMRWKVTRSPAAQLVEMTLGPPDGSDAWMGMIRPTDVEAMDDQGKSLSSRSMMHFCEFGFNYRNVPLDDVNFRHALAHLVPKEMIIGTLFKYIDVPVSTPVAPAQGLWYNPYVDPHPYSRDEADDILGAAGYQKIGGEWKMPDTSEIPNIRVYIPLEIVAPTSYTIGRMFVDECHAIGLTSVNLEPMDFSTYTSLAFDEWDFDIFWVCWRLGVNPTLLYFFFHSSQNYQGSNNCYGIDWEELDDEIEIFYYGLDHPAKIAAAKKAQEMLMGGTTTDPLAMPAQADRDQAIPLIPVYSRNAYDTQQPELRGAVNMFGYGIENTWTWMNIYWDTPNEYRPGTNEKIVVPILDEFPETLNPVSYDTVYAADCMEDAWDGLIATNPYTHRDLPWLATSWSYGAEAGGMYITYNLRTTDNYGQPIRWQDGDPIAPSDVKFAWDFLHDNEIADTWGSMTYYIDSEIVGNEITAHMSTTSQWLVYSLSGFAYLLPPQVWQVWDGQPAADIEAWDPSAVPGPGGLPTSVFGTGPFILQHSTTFVSTAGYCDEVANRNYWLTTAEIQDIIATMFHSAGDVDSDGQINIPGDLYRIGAAWHKADGDPGWDADADVCGPLGGPPDLYIDIDDLSTAGKFYGETRTVP